MDNLKSYLEKQLPENEIFFGEELKNHTTFRVGGPADYYCKPGSVDTLSKVLQLCKQENIPYYVIGNGSNMLFHDKGFRGMIIEIGSGLSEITWLSETRVKAQAGGLLSKLAAEAARHSLTGFEFAAGIPGSLGGAVTMNAGAYGGEIKDCIVEATILTEDNKIQIFTKEELKLSYRHSAVMEQKGIVLDATFDFCKGDELQIRQTMSELALRRKEKQPLEYPSAGSTFKRPEGYFAGKLVQDAGLRGFRIGGAMVSEKHCGFVINYDKATSDDIRKLMAAVNDKVYEQFGVHLEPEVRIVGEFL